MKQSVKSSELLDFATVLLEEGKEATFTINGNSMRPFYKSKATSVTLRGINDFQVKRFDVVLYMNNNQYLLHRIVKVNEKNLIIMGDALRIKEVVDINNVKGVVIKHEYKGKIIFRDNKFYLFKVKVWYWLRGIRRILLRIFR